jgi:hypothetical protein
LLPEQLARRINPLPIPSSRPKLSARALSKSARLKRHCAGGTSVPTLKQAMEIQMQYLLLIYGNEAGMQKASKADIDQMHAAYGAYTEALKKAGVIVGGNRLKPSPTATTVRVADGKTQVLNGPYAETKEQLAGYYMVDVPDLDAALAWAARCPGASHGVMEVRPVWPE